MNSLRRVTGITLLAVGVALATVGAGPAQQAPQTAVLTPERIEAFLLTAKISRLRPVSIGVTGSRRATLTDGDLTHDAHVQIVDEYKGVYTTPEGTEIGFQDNFRFNIAAYKLAVLLGIENVPVSVIRSVNREQASVTWWVDDVMMDERERQKRGVDDPDMERRNHYQFRMRVFDELIQNRDRNQTNVLYTSEWKVWMIDHTRAFRMQRTLLTPARLGRIDRTLFEKLQALTAEALAKAVQPHVDGRTREAVLARRDAIVAHFKARIAAIGEDSVLYTFQP